jgi:hypothetical protein
MSEKFFVRESDLEADSVLNELSDQEILGAEKTMNALLRWINSDGGVRAELVQATLICSLLISRHHQRRTAGTS